MAVTQGIKSSYDITAASIEIGNTSPTVASVSSNTASGSYKAGDVIDIDVVFSEVVTVSGTPQITLETGSTDQVVNYSSGSGTAILTFNYTVQPNDTSADLDYISTSALTLNGGSIQDANGNNAILTLTSPGASNSLGANEAIVIDTGVPTIASTTVASNNSTIDVTFSEAVYNATGGSGALEVSDFTLSLSGGTATLASVTPSSISISGNVYTLGLSLTGNANGSETVTVAPSSSTAIYDAADNAASTSQSNNTVGLSGVDVIDPTMIITATSSRGSVSSGAASSSSTLSLTFTSSESTLNFVKADVSITNGSIGTLSGSGKTYTAILTPTAQGLVSVSVATGAYTDTANNNNEEASFSWTYLSDPTAKADVVGNTKAWTNTSSKWAGDITNVVSHRLDWLSRHKGSLQTSHQGVKIRFNNELINTVMNTTPKSKKAIVAEIDKHLDPISKVISLLQDTENAFVAGGEAIKSDAQMIAINEAARLREGWLGNLNPTFGKVINDWSMWTAGEISIGKEDATASSSKQESDSQTISLGFDKPVRGSDLLGFALSIGQSSTDVGESSSQVKSDNYALSTYSTFNQPNGIT